jgi:Reprolysin (M12B) family zinc metalloprotease/Disintegrin/Thrombospondin type 1 domain/Reprolysin family propeptide
LERLEPVSLEILREDSRQFLSSLSTYETITPSKLPPASTATLQWLYPHHDGYQFEAFGRAFSIHLERNLDMFHPDFHVNLWAENNVDFLESYAPDMHRLNCYYNGYVRDDPDSSVAINTCRGLTGIIHAYNDTFLIQPKDPARHANMAVGHAGTHTQHSSGSATHYEYEPLLAPSIQNEALEFSQFQNRHTESHIIVRERDMPKRKAGKCGVGEHHRMHNHDNDHAHADGESFISPMTSSLSLSRQELMSWSRRQLELSGNSVTHKYNELHAVADTKQRTSRGSNTATVTYIVDVIFYVSLAYHRANFNPFTQIVLRDVSILSSDPWVVESNGECDAEKMLNGFSTWKQGNAASADNAQLLSACEFVGSTIGLAWLGVICKDNSAGVNQATYTTSVFDLKYASSTVAHEMGHNFNMDHDGEDSASSCNPSNFIMAAYASSSVPADFSTCSHSTMTSYWASNSATLQCLNNIPASSYRAKCGDGFVDPGEQCDPGEGTDPCCNSATCQLTSGAVCAANDDCCTAQCGVVSASQNKVCRPKADSTCDIAETCNGQTASCPSDQFANAGTSCTNSGKCYLGTCISLTSQCKSLESNGYSAYAPIVPCNNGNNCGNLLCGDSGNANTCYQWNDADNVLLKEQDGIPCGSGQQCKSGSCVDSNTLNPVTYDWNIGLWGSCSKTCGSGTRTRSIECRDNTGDVVSDSNCVSSSAKPSATEACNTDTCHCLLEDTSCNYQLDPPVVTFSDVVIGDDDLAYYRIQMNASTHWSEYVKVLFPESDNDHCDYPSGVVTWDVTTASDDVCNKMYSVDIPMNDFLGKCGFGQRIRNGNSMFFHQTAQILTNRTCEDGRINQLSLSSVELSETRSVSRETQYEIEVIAPTNATVKTGVLEVFGTALKLDLLGDLTITPDIDTNMPTISGFFVTETQYPYELQDPVFELTGDFNYATFELTGTYCTADNSTRLPCQQTWSYSFQPNQTCPDKAQLEGELVQITWNVNCSDGFIGECAPSFAVQPEATFTLNSPVYCFSSDYIELTPALEVYQFDQLTANSADFGASTLGTLTDKGFSVERVFTIDSQLYAEYIVVAAGTGVTLTATTLKKVSTTTSSRGELVLYETNAAEQVITQATTFSVHDTGFGTDESSDFADYRTRFQFTWLNDTTVLLDSTEDLAQTIALSATAISIFTNVQSLRKAGIDEHHPVLSKLNADRHSKEQEDKHMILFADGDEPRDSKTTVLARLAPASTTNTPAAATANSGLVVTPTVAAAGIALAAVVAIVAFAVIRRSRNASKDQQQSLPTSFSNVQLTDVTMPVMVDSNVTTPHMSTLQSIADEYSANSDQSICHTVSLS